jgi:MFS family permease
MNALRALRHRNFSLFISGQVFGIVGYWVQIIALQWFLYRTTGSSTLLGVMGFASNLPVLLLAPLVGLWADRFNRHRLMWLSQILEMLHAVTLTACAFAGWLTPATIIALQFALGVFIALELPVRHAYLLELMDDRADLPNAVAVMSLTMNCGRLLGPAAAGLLIGRLDEAWCFLIYAGTYIFVLGSFAFLRPRATALAAEAPSALSSLHEGLRYAWGHAPIRALLGILACIAFVATPYSMLVPALVRERFDGSGALVGYLVSAAGFGALAGTAVLAWRPAVKRLPGAITVAAIAAGIALTGLASTRSLWLAFALMSVIGFSILTVSVSVNMLLQSLVDDDKRGRVMSLYTAAFVGIMPFGALAAGATADAIGAPYTLLAGGIVCAVAGLVLARRLPALSAGIARSLTMARP